MLELAILGLLLEQAMHGYELKKQLNQKLGHFWQVSLGSLYPTLNRLAERGAIEAVFSEETSRRKNVYRITPVGEREFLELMGDRATTQWEEEKFPLRFAFFRYVKPEIRIRLLERRRAYLQDKLDDLRSSLRESHDRIDSYTLSLMRHGMDATASDIAWLDELIAAERRQLLVDAEDEPDGGGRPSPTRAPSQASALPGEPPFEPLFEGRGGKEQQRSPSVRLERMAAEAAQEQPEPGTTRKTPRTRRRQTVERRPQPGADPTRQKAPEGHGHQTAPATGD